MDVLEREKRKLTGSVLVFQDSLVYVKRPLISIIFRLKSDAYSLSAVLRGKSENSRLFGRSIRALLQLKKLYAQGGFSRLAELLILFLIVKANDK